MALTWVVFFCAILTTCRAQSNEGNEFALIFFDNVNTPTYTVFVTTAEDNPVPFTISSQFQGFYREGIAMPGQVNSFLFDQSFALLTTTDRGKAIIVKASKDQKLIVYGANEAQYSTDTFLALPPLRAESGDLKYICAMATPWLSSDSMIGIVSFENNTVLSITPSQTTTIGSALTTAGSTTQITLQKYDSFLIRQSGDLTGTTVISNKPISFITGHHCTNVPPNIGACDHLIEQLPPIKNWGNRFVTVPLKIRLAYDRFKVVAGEDATTVQIVCTRDENPGLSTSFTLQEGEFRDVDIPSTDYCWIEGDNRIILLQFSVGQGVDDVLSDPFMAMIPPVNQYSNEYTLTTVPDGVQTYTHFMNLYIPKNFFQLSEIFLNGQSLEELNLNFVAIQRLGVTEVYGAQVNISGGVQVLRHASKLARIGVIVYGFGNFNSYGYPGGLRLKELAKDEIGKLGVTPTKTSNNSAKIVWTEPFTEEPVKEYEVDVLEVVTKNTSILVQNFTTNETEAEIKDLKPGRDYDVEVTAILEGENATRLPTERVEVSTEESAPTGPPQNIQCTALSDSSITCQWDPPPPDDRNGIVRRYDIVLTDHSTDVTSRYNTTEENITFNNLKSCNNYGVSIAAFTVDLGPFSMEVNQITIANVDAAAPQGLRGMPDCSVEPFQLFWDPLTTDVKCITGYVVRYEIVETGRTFEETTQNTSIKVLDTKQLSTYNFIVAAKFPGGTGPFSESVVLKSGVKGSVALNLRISPTLVGAVFRWSVPRSVSSDIKTFQLSMHQILKGGRLKKIKRVTLPSTYRAFHISKRTAKRRPYRLEIQPFYSNGCPGTPEFKMETF